MIDVLFRVAFAGLCFHTALIAIATFIPDRAVNWLAGRSWGRVALIPHVLWVGAWNWGTYLDGTPNAQDAGRVRDCWGWLAAVMEPEWDRLADRRHPDYGSRLHSEKNIGAEWSRSDVQRSYKALAFVAVALYLAGVVLPIAGFCLAVSLAGIF